MGNERLTRVGFGLERAKDVAVQEGQSEGMWSTAFAQLEPFWEGYMVGIGSDL